jgi:superfamily II DNA or RNA helicase
MPPVAAFSMLEREHLLGPVEADTLSVDLVEMSLAVGIGRPGLTALQDLAVSQMLATETGAMLAHPPGSGKTVIAVAALAESVSRRILVVVPKATLPQWQAELNTWAPGLPVRIPHSSAELGRATSSRGVTLTTLDMASSWALDASTDGHWDELIVDEAAALVKSSTRTRGLWVLREHATRAFALTGTPGEAHGSVDTADIVAWCRNLPRSVVRPVPDADFQPVLLLPRFDPDLPTLNVNIVKCTPSSADARWLQELGLMRENALTPFDRSRVKELVRRGLGDPLGAGSQASWSKRDLILKVLADHARERGSALLFATSIPAASEIVRLLQLEGIPAGVLSGELSRQARAQMLASFASGETSVLAVTPSAQRGVNLEMASLVVHQDMPVSRSIFDQRNARAARMNSTHRVIRVVIPVLEGTWDERWSQAVLTSTFGEVNPLDYA